MTDNVPKSERAERAVLGAVLINPVAYLNVAEFLKPDDFFYLRYSYIWQAIGKLETSGVAVDTVTVSEELQRMGVLADVGGPAILTQLIGEVPTSVHAEVYGHMVERTSWRRKLLLACDDVKAMVVDQSISTEKIFEQAENAILNITGFGVEKKPTDVFTIAHNMLDSVENLREMREKGITPGIPTGYPDWDNITGGSYKKEIVVIAGPDKSGKSTLSLNVCRNRLAFGARGVIFITEMTRQALTRKFAAMEAGLPAKTIKDVAFNPQQYSRFVEATRKISEWKLDIIDDYPALTPLDVRRELRRLTHKYAIDFVVIDGLWQMSADAGVKFDAKTYEIAYIMKKLRMIKDDFNVPIDLVHQCNRAASLRKDKRPMNSDLADSASVPRDANTTVFLFRENYYDPDGTDTLEVIVRSNREGNSGTAYLQFDKGSEKYHTMRTIPVQLAPESITPLKPPNQPKLVDIQDERKDIYQ
jgi:replicative DNA helicase